MDTASQKHCETSPDSAFACVNDTTVDGAVFTKRTPGTSEENDSSASTSAPKVNIQPMRDKAFTTTFEASDFTISPTESPRADNQPVKWSLYDTFVQIWLQITMHSLFMYFHECLNCLRRVILRNFTKKNVIFVLTGLGTQIFQHLYANPRYLCHLPLASSTVICTPPRLPVTDQLTHHGLDLTALMTLQGNMDNAAIQHCDGQWQTMVVELRDIQTGAKDLLVSVKHSDLLLAADISRVSQNFINTVGQAIKYVRSLGVLACATNSKLSTIDARGLVKIQQAFENRSWSPFSFSWFRHDLCEEAAKDAFLQMLTETSALLRTLLHGCDLTQGVFMMMENQIQDIQDLSSDEEYAVSRNHRDILNSFWTYLGGNKAKIEIIKLNLAKLSNVAQWTTEAQSSTAHIHDSLVVVSEEIILLRDEVSKPVVEGKVDESWLRVELQAFRNGKARLEARISGDDNSLDGPP